MLIQAFINFKGNCKEAVNFYADVFKCEQPQFMTFGDLPPNDNFMPLSEEQKKLILFTELKIGESTIMFSDVFEEMPLNIGNNINITIGSNNKEIIKEWFEKLKVGGKVHMEPQKTFWSDYYAMLVDKFGIPWQMNYYKD